MQSCVVPALKALEDSRRKLCKGLRLIQLLHPKINQEAATFFPRGSLCFCFLVCFSHPFQQQPPTYIGPWVLMGPHKGHASALFRQSPLLKSVSSLLRDPSQLPVCHPSSSPSLVRACSYTILQTQFHTDCCWHTCWRMARLLHHSLKSTMRSPRFSVTR